MRLCLLILLGTMAAAAAQAGGDRQAAYRQLRDEARLATLVDAVTKNINEQRYAEALKKADEALKLKPGDAVTLNARGAALTELGRYEEAVQSLNAAVAAAPDSFPPQYNLGEALALQKKYGDAADQFVVLQTRFGTMPILKYKIYICYALDGQKDKAAAALKALASPMDGPAWYYAHAVDEFLSGRKSEARSLLDVADAIHPDEVKTYRETLGDTGLLK